LQPLGPRDIDELLAHVLDGPVDDAPRGGLWELSRGNALFLRELVLGGLEAGTLERRDGKWRWQGPFRPNNRLREVIRDRLMRTGAGSLDVLEHVAIGEPLPLDVLARLQRGVYELMSARVRAAQEFLEQSCSESDNFIPLAAPHLVEAYALTSDAAGGTSRRRDRRTSGVRRCGVRRSGATRPRVARRGTR
jgi:hypothetical protein